LAAKCFWIDTPAMIASTEAKTDQGTPAANASMAVEAEQGVPAIE